MATLNVGSLGAQMHMGPARQDFQEHLEQAIKSLARSAQLIGLQEPNHAHAEFLQSCPPAGWHMEGYGHENNGTHVLWDSRVVRVIHPVTE